MFCFNQKWLMTIRLSSKDEIKRKSKINWNQLWLIEAIYDKAQWVAKIKSS